MANKKAPKTNNEIYARILERVLKGLEQGNIVWRMPWTIVNNSDDFQNPISNAVYSGQNRFLLMWAMLIEGWDSPYFATYKQVKQAGGQVIKGSAGVPLVKYFPVKETRNEAAERMGINKGSVQDTDRAIKFLRPSYFTVFNLKSQTEGCETITPEYSIVKNEFFPIEIAEQIMANYADAPELVVSTKAVYSPHFDTIGMPPAETFDIPEEYYSTWFHEAAHSTGHSSRLNRVFGGRDTKQYAIEELIAEFTAAMLCGEAGIDNKTIDNSVAYIQSWREALTENPDVMFKAMNQAIAAAEYIQGQHEPEPVESPEIA